MIRLELGEIYKICWDHKKDMINEGWWDGEIIFKVIETRENTDVGLLIMNSSSMWKIGEYIYLDASLLKTLWMYKGIVKM